jgi:hypothetical protein
VIVDGDGHVVDGSDCCGTLPEDFGDVLESYLRHTSTVGHRPGRPAARSGDGIEQEVGDTLAEMSEIQNESSSAAPLDLDQIERDLADVEIALARLDAGTYWVDEITGTELPAELLAANPTVRRLA